MAVTVTIGICVYNEEKNIGKILDYLKGSKFGLGLEKIIIVCSGCTDRSIQIVKERMRNNKKIELFIEKERMGKYSAMNVILRNAKGKYIIFIDGDALPVKNALNYLVDSFSNPKIGAVTGRILPAKNNGKIINFFEEFIWNLHHQFSYSYRKITAQICAIEKGLIKKIPDKIINDDGYFTAKILQTHEIAYEPRAASINLDNINFYHYIKKRKRIAQGYMQLSKMNLDVSIPKTLIMKLLIRRIVSEPEKFFHILLAVIVEIYCNMLAFFDMQRDKLDYKWENE